MTQPFHTSRRLALVALWVAVVAPSAWGQGYPMAQAGREGVGPRDSRSFSDTIRRVQRSTGGQILGTESVPFGDSRLTRVKYMDERGRVHIVYHPEGGQGGPPPANARSPAPSPSDAPPPPRADHQ